MLHQQCWYWGRDICRTEGNLLIEYGFERHRPPEGEEGSSRYRLELGNGHVVLLWGFGMWFGGDERGGVYLNRYEFEPRWSSLGEIDRPIWKPNMISKNRTPPCEETPARLTGQAALWIAGYERWILHGYGASYRLACLAAWPNARKARPALEIPDLWNQVANLTFAALPEEVRQR